VDDRKNLPDYESLTRRVRATPQNQFEEFTEKQLLYPMSQACSSNVVNPRQPFRLGTFA
jgi:hypothetical protein